MTATLFSPRGSISHTKFAFYRTVVFMSLLSLQLSCNYDKVQVKALNFKELSRDWKNFNIHFKHWKSQRSYSEGSGMVESSPQI